jgi:predicted Zn-dependent protease
MKPNLFAKLTLRFTISISFTLLLSLYIGCVNLATLEEMGNSAITAFSDINIFTDAEELQFGQEYVAQHDRKVTFYTDPVVTGYINALGQSLVRHSKRSNIRYTFKVVNKKGVNAYAVPGGYIYVHLDLIRAAKNESELAAVLGHEIGHIVGRHSMKRLTQAYSIELLKQLVLDEDSSKLKKLVADVLAAGLLFRYNRDNEREADFYGVQNIYDAGIAPEGAATFFETMHALRRSTPSALEQLLSTHPMPMERVTNVRTQINRLPPKSGLRSDSSRFQRVKRRVR